MSEPSARGARSGAQSEGAIESPPPMPISLSLPGVSVGPAPATTPRGSAEIVLRDPARRNALGRAMFDALESALRRVGAHEGVSAVILHGEGSAFCAGFDLEEAVADPNAMGDFIVRLGGVLRTIRRLPMPVIAVAHGAALAGGCALLSACDFVVVAADATLGYPVHRIGVSPAVTTPTLASAIGPGPSRALLLSGELIDGHAAVRVGLAFRAAEDAASALAEGRRLAERLAEKGPVALRATKAWLNELDGSLDDRRFDGATAASTALAAGAEATALLRRFWESRREARRS
ncbi:MAG TPA: enoyl-CoA hydratase/isomerase family protein [Phycisphaerales bacterium]|nr:enoyl-CoA hydratase/isomerase family protein [Phycisphaerales bacterium]HMP37521.1 enoyl-CoA hydratase/isomerase family protein [Phycisphaerales bacterium]